MSELWHNVTLCISVFLATMFLVMVYFCIYPKKRKTNAIRFMTAVAMFGAFASILYVIPVFSISLPFLPQFLQLHFDEIPAFVAGFAYGPWAAVGTLLVKTLIKLPFTTTLGVGELTDLVLSSVFVLPSALLYKRIRNLKGVFIGFAVSFVLQVIAGALLNIYVMIPLYMFVMGFSQEALLAACKLANSNITDIGWSYALFAVVPLNIIKDTIVLVVTFFVYKSIHVLLKPHLEK